MVWMLEHPKYIKVASLQDANEKAELYSLRESIVYTYAEDQTGRIKTDVEYLMSLREESKYDNVEKFKKVDLAYEEQEVSEGWIMIHHTSKEVVLVKKNVEPRYTLEEAIEELVGGGNYIHVDNAYEYVCDNPPTRGI